MERAEYHRHSRARMAEAAKDASRHAAPWSAGRAGAHRPSEAQHPRRSSDVLPRIARERSVPTGATRCENASKWAGVSAFFNYCTNELSHIFNKQAYLSISNELVLRK